MENNIPVRPGERVFLWFLLILGILALVYSFTLPQENLSSPGTFPVFISSILILSALCILWKNRKIYQSSPLGKELALAANLAFPKMVAVFAIILILYILLIQPIHFIFSSYLFLLGSFFFLKGTTFIRSVFLAAAVLGIIYFIFQYIFKVILW